MPWVSKALSVRGRSPLKIRSPKVSVSISAMPRSAANATIAALCASGTRSPNGLWQETFTTIALMSCRLAARSSFRRSRPSPGTCGTSIARMCSACSASSISKQPGALDRDHVARPRDRPDRQDQRFRRSRGHQNVVGMTGRPLPEDQTRDLPAKPQVAAPILIAHRVLRERRQREAQRSVQAVHRQQRRSDHRRPEVQARRRSTRPRSAGRRGAPPADHGPASPQPAPGPGHPAAG